MDKKELTKLLHKKYHGLFRDTLVGYSFKRSKTNDYIRVTSEDIVQTINIQKHSWDTQFTFNITVFPLFFKSEFIYFAFSGIRAGQFKNKTDYWWNYTDEHEIDSSLQDCLNLFKLKILPFFDKISNSKGLLDHLNSPDNLFSSYKYHPKSHNNEVGLLLARMGEVENAVKFIDREILNQIDLYGSFDNYLADIIHSAYEKFKIDKEKYKFYTAAHL